MERIDDVELADGTLLWRRIVPAWITTEANGLSRPQSWSFIDRHTNEVSVFIAELTDEETVLNGHLGDSIVAFTAGIPRSVGGIVAKTPEDPNLAHRVLCYQGGSQMKRAAKKITEEGSYEWVVLNPGGVLRPLKSGKFPVYKRLAT
jgi:alkylated DNA nucleotide flippase Atl1